MAATRYRAPPADALRIVALDDLVAVHHRTSGITHLVDRTTPELLSALGADWTTADTLLTRLAEMFDLPDASRDALAARLDELALAGLVERA